MRGILQQKLLLWLVPLAGLLLALSLMPYQVDDAYITYRYAWNFASGDGMAYNPGQPPTEGFSSPMWMLLLSLGACFLPMAALPYWGMILGLVAYIVLLGLFWYCSRKESPWLRILILSILTFWPGFVFYAATGMEMLLFSLCVLAVHAAAMDLLKPGPGMTAAFLAAWIRPEAPWLPLVILCSFLPFAALRGNLFSRRVIKIGLGMLMGGLSLLVLRLLVFGQVLPNTYYAKIPDYSQGLVYLKDFAFSFGGFSLIVLALGGAWLGGQRHRSFLIAGLLWMLAPVLEGGDWMPHHRFFLPAVLFLLLAVPGLARSPGKALLRLGGSLALLLLAVMIWQDRQMIVNARNSFDSLTVRERAIAEWARNGAVASIAAVDIGVMGYYSQAEITDVVGLTDPLVSRSGGGHLGKDFNLDYLFAHRRPQCIILRSTIRPQIENGILQRCRAGSEVEARILLDSRLIRDYRLLMSLELRHNSRQSKLLFIRRDHPLSREPNPVQRQFF